MNLLKFFNQKNGKIEEEENPKNNKLEIEEEGTNKTHTKNPVQELIEKEVEDSLFHLGDWEHFISTIEKKYPAKSNIYFT
jgi:hypothetical protein